jgi:hypothetical protein
VEAYDYVSGDSLASVEKEFAIGKYYSTFVVGSGNNVQNVVVEDDVDSLSGSSGQAYVRYINAVNGSAMANVTIAAGGSEVVNDQAAFAEVSGFTGLAAGEITVNLSEGSAISATRTFSVEAGRVYTVLLLSGSHAGEPAQIRYVSNGKLDDATESRGVNASFE